MSDTRRNPGFGIRDSGLGARDSGFPPSPGPQVPGFGVASGIQDSGEHTPIDIDAAIDVVAREMTDVDPSAAMRAQVLERIEQGRRRPGLVLPRWAWAGVAATMVLAVATGLWLARPVQGPGGSEGTVAEQRAAGPKLANATAPRPSARPGTGPGPTAASPAGRPALSARAQLGPATHGAQSAVGTAAGAVAEDDALVPALAAIEPLRLSAVEPAGLHIPGVEVAPLGALPTIDIPSLNPGSTDAQSADPKKEK